MKNKITSLCPAIIVFLLPICLFSRVAAEETIIKKEELSFEKCLKVITKSESELATTAKITDLSNKKRIAIFGLEDGTLQISCDGYKGLVIVSTKVN